MTTFSTLLGSPFLQLFDNQGAPLAGGTLETYVAGTDTPLETFSDSARTVTNGTSVTLDAGGRPSTGAVYLQPTGYKFILKDAAGAVVDTQDNVLDLGALALEVAQFHVARSQIFDLDNGSGTTIDDVLLRLSKAITVTAARIVYVEETTGTVEAGSIKVGITLGGEEIVADAAYEDGALVGSRTALTLVDGSVPANTGVFVRHTGVAATQAGKAFVEVEFTVDLTT